MTEYQLFELLPKDGERISGYDLADARVKLGNWDVAHPINNVTVVMNRLIEKVKTNKEPFRIGKGGQEAGHHITEYWLEPRAQKKRNGK